MIGQVDKVVGVKSNRIELMNGRGPTNRVEYGSKLTHEQRILIDSQRVDFDGVITQIVG